MEFLERFGIGKKKTTEQRILNIKELDLPSLEDLPGTPLASEEPLELTETLKEQEVLRPNLVSSELAESEAEPVEGVIQFTDVASRSEPAEANTDPVSDPVVAPVPSVSENQELLADRRRSLSNKDLKANRVADRRARQAERAFEAAARAAAPEAGLVSPEEDLDAAALAGAALAAEAGIILGPVTAEAAHQQEEPAVLPENPVEIKAEVPLANEIQPENQPETLEPLAKLRMEVADARWRFAEEEWSSKSTLSRLREKFPFLKEQEESQDLAAMRTKYQSALGAFKESQLQSLKEKGLDGEALTAEMESLLKYFQIDEAQSLADASTQVRKEHAGWGGALVLAYDKLGENYNKLSRTQKILVTASFLGASVTLGAIGGTAALTVAGAGVVARRIVSGAGMAATLDTALAAWQEKKEQEQEETALAENIESIGGQEDNQFEKLSAFLDNSISELDEKLKQKRKKTFWRKTGSVALGAGSGVLMSYLFSSDGAPSQEIPVEQPQVPAEALPSTPVPEGASVANQTIDFSSTPEAGIPEAAVAEGAGETAQESVPQATEKIVAVSAEHIVTQEDGRKGLWGILESRLPESLPESDKNRIVLSLENAIQNKLSGLPPEAWPATGFSAGDINTIHPGDALHFDQLLTASEYQEILAGKVVEPLAAASEAAQVMAEETGGDLDNILDGVAETAAEEAQLDGTAAESLAAEAEPSSFEDPTLEALRSGEVPFEPYRQMLGETRQAIFVTEETRNWPKFLNAGLQKETVGDIMKASETLAADPAASVQTSLHPSQVERVARFSALAQDQFGTEGRFGRNETLEQYTRRLTTIDFQRNGGSPVLAGKFTKIINV